MHKNCSLCDTDTHNTSECTKHDCQLPPAGWYCTRGAGHGGPCAAICEACDRQTYFPLNWTCHVCGQRSAER